MNQSKSRPITLRRMVIFLCVILGLLHVILLGWTAQRKSASKQLTEDRVVLEENLDQLQQINQEQLDELRAELELVEGEISTLEASFPELGGSFAIYQQGYALALDSQLDLQEISLVGSETLDTVSGQLLRKQYILEVIGSLENCLGFIDNLEQAGLDTINMDFITINPVESQCSLEISTLGYPSGTD